MSSAWTFGRIGLATSAGGDGLELPAHDAAKWDGDTVTLVCDLPQSTVADQLVLREQFLGYDLNPDERQVAITSVNAPDINGIYTVEEVNVDDRLGTYLEGGEGSIVTIVATRVPDAVALFEVLTAGGDRVNSHGLVGLGWAAYPGSASDRSIVSEDSASLVGGGTVRWLEGDYLYDDSFSFGTAPANAYEAAVWLRVDDRTVVGNSADNDGQNWAISNGLVEIKGSATAANHFVVGVRNSGATDYDEKEYRVGLFNVEPYEFGYNGTTRVAPGGPIVLRNSAECVSIRLLYTSGYQVQFDGGDPSSTEGTPAYLDVTLRRGAFYAEFALSSALGSTGNFGVWRASTDAGTSITGGIEDNAADGAGNKWRIYTPKTRTADTTNGGLYANTSLLPFAIGNNRAIYTTGVTLADAYFAAMNHRQAIVAR